MLFLLEVYKNNLNLNSKSKLLSAQGSLQSILFLSYNENGGFAKQFI